MFGLLRTTLALMVMVFHLFIGIFPLGFYAVFGFYIISGYLMTLIMHQSYGYTPYGRTSFLINRFLRLYPSYWVAAFFSIMLIVSIDSQKIIQFHDSIFMPTSWQSVLSNLFMIFPAWYPNEVNPRLVPPTWALTVEIFFYALICLGASKTFRRVIFWILLSIGYVIFSFIAGWPRGDRYFPILAASLPFSIGAAIYFVSKSSRVYSIYIKMRLKSSHLFLLMLGNCFIWILLTRKENLGVFIEVGSYVNQVLCALLVYSIARGGMILPLDKRIDSFIGDFSYPIYLFHWSTGLLVSFLLYGEGVHEFSYRGLLSLSLSMVFILSLSALLIVCIDRPIDRIRNRIKKQ